MLTWGSPEPFGIPIASLIRTAAGGVLVMKVEGAVLVDRDLDRDDRPAFGLGLGVEGFAELHDVDAVLAQRGADRRRRVGVAGLDLQLDEGEDFFGHRVGEGSGRR